ncbi:MAG: MFS transporter [Nitrococcus sp.]|nr:MFS transporter [Nitrococcus sp.]
MATDFDKTPRSTSPSSAWAPLRHRAFAVLWSATIVSNIGTWMNSVGAGWLMTSLAPSPTMVALVQAATTLPVFMLALPAGALADIVDRRRILLICQFGMCALVAVLALLVWREWVTAQVLLLFTFLLGAGKAVAAPAWQAVIPKLVPRDALQPAIALNSIGINVSRAIGPALAGLLIVTLGMATPFAVDAVSFLAVVAALIWWNPPPSPPSMLPAERFSNAMRTGLRYARSSGPLRATLLRACAYLFFANAFWALLPLISRHSLQGEATLYGLLLAGVGVGAILGGLLLPKFKARIGSDQTVAIATGGTAIMTAVFAVVSNVPIALAASVAFGMGWIAALASLAGSAQVALPDWVRARGLSVYMMVMFGSMTLGSIAWGQVAELYSIRISLLVAAAGALVVIPLVSGARLNQGETLDLSPSLHWPAPVVAGEIKPDRGPVMTTIEYQTDPADARAFVAALADLSHARRRAGAFAWGMFEDAAVPGRYLEYFMESSWVEHLRHHERVTVADRPIQDRVVAFHRGESAPHVTHYLAPESGR